MPAESIATNPWLERGVAVVVAVGVALCFFTSSDLWLDEALTVNIAGLPIGDIPSALRHDGAPPLYYFLLHGWMRVFGTSDFAVRALSGVFAVATFPAMWFCARRVGGREMAAAALVLIASSPFTIRYATEARMYSLVVLLVLVGYVSLSRALERPAFGRLSVLAVVTGLALLTHYWTIYLLAAVTAAVTWRAVRGPRATDARRVLGALLAGGLMFVPWLPSFIYQLRHTGTPWSEPLGVSDAANAAISVATGFSGGDASDSRALAFVLVALAGFAVFGRATGRFRIELDLRTRPGVRVEAIALVATVVIAIVVGIAAGSAFEARYLAVIFGLFVLTAAAGVGVLADRRLRMGVLAVAVALGFAGGVRNVVTNRTQGGDVAEVINEQARPGDVVAYCPDQLGPSVHRYLDVRVSEAPFPASSNPQLVDWADYEERNRAADPKRFAFQVLDRAGQDDVWLVFATAYTTYEGKCEALFNALAEARPGAQELIRIDPQRFERHTLVRFRAPGATGEPGS